MEFRIPPRSYARLDGTFRPNRCSLPERGQSFRTTLTVENVRSLCATRSHVLRMPPAPSPSASTDSWSPTPDGAERFSSGIPAFDRLLGGGFPRGGLALFEIDHTIGPADRSLLLTPTCLNFLYQSRGVLAVLSSRESPKGFRADLTRWVSRRRFDTRVRVVVYAGGEDAETPYVVDLSNSLRAMNGPPATKKKSRDDSMKKMTKAEVAVKGTRKKPFLEMVSFEIADVLFGPEVAGRMFFHGVKRARMVGNLVVGILRPGVGCAEAVRGMADVTLGLTRTELGLTVRGIQPSFPAHLVVVDPRQGPPHVSFLPAA
jgi:GvpD gas vesicle protein